MQVKVGRQDAVMVLEILEVVADRAAEQIRQASAGLFDNYLRAAGIPDLGARRQVNVHVAYLFSDKPDLESY